MFEPQAFFSKLKAEKTILSRDSVQSIPLWGHHCDFLLGVALGFESFTKPQQEAQNGHLEYTISFLSL